MSVTDHWAADPSWPQEQQRLFERLKERFAAHLVRSDMPSDASFSPGKEQQILDQIDRGRWDQAMTLKAPPPSTSVTITGSVSDPERP